MKKPYRIIAGFSVTCLCFFLSMIFGSLHSLSAEPILEPDSIVSFLPFLENEDNSTEIQSALQIANGSPEKTPINGNNNCLSNSENSNDLILMQLSPTPTNTPIPTPTPSPSPTPTPTNTPTPSPSPTPSPTPEPFTTNIVISATSGNLNIRSGPSTNDSIVGKLHSGGYAVVLERQGDWTKITTGSIQSAYVSSDHLFFDEEVLKICDEDESVHATVTAKSLHVRSGPGTSFDSIQLTYKEDTYPVRLTQSYRDWIAIVLSDGSIGYVFSKHVALDYDLKPGLSMEEIEEEERQAAIERAMARARIYSVAETTRNPMTMTEDELYLFATVIYNEAGDQGYDGMLAVANVILNRMENGHWGTTLSEVLFSPGQFTGARQEYIDRAQKRGIPEICYTVAKDALSGHNNIGDFLFFCADYIAEYTKYDVFYILKEHVFYKRTW